MSLPEPLTEDCVTEKDLQFFALVAKGAFAAAFLGPDHAEDAARRPWAMLAGAELEGDLAAICSALVITLDATVREMLAAAELERQIALRSTWSGPHFDRTRGAALRA